MKRFSLWAGLALVAVIGASLLAVLAELGVRHFTSHNNALDLRSFYNLEYRPSGFVRQVPAGGQEVYALGEGGRVRFDHRLYRVDRHGLRSPGGDLPVEKPVGELRVLFLGGSHVFDVHCHDAEDCPGYPELTGRALRDEGLPVQVMNGGVPGQESRSFAAQLSLEWHRFQPDLVVLASAWNDIKWMSRQESGVRMLEAPAKRTANPLISPASRLDAWFGASVLYRKVRDRYWVWRLGLEKRHLEGLAAAAPVAEPDLERAFEQYRVNFLAAAEVARGIGALPVLALEERLVAPDNDDEEKGRIAYRMVSVESHEHLVKLFDACDGVVRRLAEEQGLPLIDLGSELSARRVELFVDHVHTTPAGSRALAAGYARELAPLLVTLQARSTGKASTSSIDEAPAASMTSRSTPRATPAHAGSPDSRAASSRSSMGG